MTNLTHTLTLSVPQDFTADGQGEQWSQWEKSMSASL